MHHYLVASTSQLRQPPQVQAQAPAQVRPLWREATLRGSQPQQRSLAPQPAKSQTQHWMCDAASYWPHFARITA